MQIGFIGAGFMGYGIALNLMKSGHLLRMIANRKRDNIEKLIRQGATEARNYNDLLVGAEAVVSCVGTAYQIEDVVTKSEIIWSKMGLKLTNSNTLFMPSDR